MAGKRAIALPVSLFTFGFAIDRKFWIEEDWKEDWIATDLVRAGVPKEDIVLAFHEPGMRQYTDFAAAS